MLRAVIIDDEASGISALQLLIGKHVENVKIVATATKAPQGIALIEDYKPEIVFLDISMPDMNGFSLLQQLAFRDFSLVFTTAHREFAIQAIKHNAVDYLLKPVDVEELQTCVAHIIDKKITIGANARYSSAIGLPVKDGIVFIRPAEIIRLEASGSYTVFYLDNKIKHVVSRSLKEYEAQLNPACFYRCHNSHLVNLQKVVKFVSSSGFIAQMSDGSTAEIARKNKEEFLEKLKNAGV
jgi:two-component system LytT family response regulator